MALSPTAWKEARATLQSLLSEENSTLQNDQELRKRLVVVVKNVFFCQILILER